MSPASHAVGRLRELYGIVLGRMRFLNERSMHPPLGCSESAPPAILEQLEPRLLLDGSWFDSHGLFPGEEVPFGNAPSDLAVGDFDGDEALVVRQPSIDG